MASTQKYEQVSEYIITEIHNGNFKTGDRIPTEEELCKKFGFSRMTVNKALVQLSDGGIIKRIQGSGSYVCEKKVVLKNAVKMLSFTEDMQKIGKKAGSILISYEVKKGSELPAIAEKLKLNPNDLIHYIVRLRSGNNEPIAITYTYVSASIIAAIDVQQLNHSFYDYLRKNNIIPVCGSLELSAKIPTAEQQKLLNISHQALLCSTSIAYAKQGNKLLPFEYAETCYNSALYTYTVDFNLGS